MTNNNNLSLSIYCDGGARGNPGPSGIGFVVKDQNNKALHLGEAFIGNATNNIAEYQAVINALRWLLKQRVKGNIFTLDSNKRSVIKCQMLLDSKLVVNQLQGNYKVKDNKLRDLFATTQHLIKEINLNITYKYIPRQQNFQADALVNKALDSQLT